MDHRRNGGRTTRGDDEGDQRACDDRRGDRGQFQAEPAQVGCRPRGHCNRAGPSGRCRRHGACKPHGRTAAAVGLHIAGGYRPIRGWKERIMSISETAHPKGRAPAAKAAAKPTVFLDGASGTTGLEIGERLDRQSDVAVKSIADDRRKDAGAKRALMEEVDLVILCLPDDAAKATVALIDSMGAAAPKVLDASTAFRVAPDWTYGFPELAPDQADKIRNARKVSNPGCYPTGAIALLRPLVDAGLLRSDYPVTINAVSGYSGGGKSMIAEFEGGSAPAFELYGLGFEHKHVPETQLYSGLTRRPIFVPSVGNYRQGMLVSVPLHLDTLPGKPDGAALHAALAKRYAGSKYVSVMPLDNDATKSGRIEPEALNETNMLELYVFASDKYRQAVLVARLDNLGKGASGAAVQNMRLMLGLSET